MALTSEQEQKLEKIFLSNLEKQRTQGIRIGMLSVSKIISDKLNDTSKPLIERISDVKKFCSVAAKDENEFLNKGIYDESMGIAENSENIAEVEENIENSGETPQNMTIPENNSAEE